MKKKTPARKTQKKAPAAKKKRVKTSPSMSPSDVSQPENDGITPPPLAVEILDDDFEPEKVEPTALSPVSQDALTSYLVQVRKYRLLTREQELEIAKRYHEKHDPKDAEILVTSNLRFVIKVAAEYAKFGAKLIDLIQEGNMGLIHAVKEYNPYKGVRLITYAVWWIRGYIQEYLMKQYSMVRIGTTQNQRRLFYRLEKEREKIDQEGGIPTVKLLSARLGVPEKDVITMGQRLSGRDVSLDQAVNEDSSSSLLDFESSQEPAVDDLLGDLQLTSLLRNQLDELEPELSEREQQLLNERLLEDNPKTLQEIGDEWGVTREAVRQMESRLLKKIKDRLTASLGQAPEGSD